MIKIENLSKVFEQDGRRVAAVDGVDLEVGRGEICVLLGPSGCGKTTTLKIINRLVVPSGGRVLVDGQDTALHQNSVIEPLGESDPHAAYRAFAVANLAVAVDPGECGLDSIA